MEYPLPQTLQSNFALHKREWFLGNAFVPYKDNAYERKVLQKPPFAQASIAYVPVKHLNAQFMHSLPDFMVVFFMKELSENTWSGQKEKQTLVTHMGILWQGQLYHASRRREKVSREDFLLYVQENSSYLGVSFYAVPQGD